MYEIFLRHLFVFVGVPCSILCKNCNGVSWYNRQFPEEDNEYKDGKIKQHCYNKRDKTKILQIWV